MRRHAKPAKVKAKPKRPLSFRKAATKDAATVHELEKCLAESLERERAKDRALVEALERQTATSEILRVISGIADGCPAGVRRDRDQRRPVAEGVLGSRPGSRAIRSRLRRSRASTTQPTLP